MAVYVAAGHGRSYGRWSRVALRGLPAILDCGLWGAALASPAARTYALVTDLGNDLAYGASAAELVAWVTECVDRLAVMETNVVLTLLPAASLARLAPWQYYLFRALLFPTCRVPFRTLRERVAEVNAGLASVATRPPVTVVEPRAEWYGADAIHIRRSQGTAAWGEIVSRWDAPSGVAAAPGARPVWPRVSCRGMAAERRTILGIRRHRSQPSGTLPDGAPVSLF